MPIVLSEKFHAEIAFIMNAARRSPNPDAVAKLSVCEIHTLGFLLHIAGVDEQRGHFFYICREDNAPWLWGVPEEDLAAETTAFLGYVTQKRPSKAPVVQSLSSRFYPIVVPQEQEQRIQLEAARFGCTPEAYAEAELMMGIGLARWYFFRDRDWDTVARLASA